MRTVMFATGASLLLTFAAQAEPRAAAVVTRDGACSSPISGVQRVAYSLPQGPECCADQLRCTQFLSTTVIEHGRADQRT